MNEVGVGARVINFLIDTLLICISAYALYKWYSFYVLYWDFKFYPFYMFFYGTLFIYYTFFEAIWSRTPGKWMSLSRVRTIDNKKPSLFKVLLRSLLRFTLIDLFFIPFIGRTLHDALSKTRVVEA